MTRKKNYDNVYFDYFNVYFDDNFEMIAYRKLIIEIETKIVKNVNKNHEFDKFIFRYDFNMTFRSTIKNNQIIEVNTQSIYIYNNFTIEQIEMKHLHEIEINDTKSK